MWLQSVHNVRRLAAAVHTISPLWSLGELLNLALDNFLWESLMLVLSDPGSITRHILSRWVSLWTIARWSQSTRQDAVAACFQFFQDWFAVVNPSIWIGPPIILCLFCGLKLAIVCYFMLLLNTRVVLPRFKVRIQCATGLLGWNDRAWILKLRCFHNISYKQLDFVTSLDAICKQLVAKS